MHQAVNGFLSPFAYETSIPNGSYTLEAGWIEPFFNSQSKDFYYTYMNPSVNVQIYPYSSLFTAFFNMRFIKFAQFGMGYKRLFFHGTMMAYDRRPQLEDWKPLELLKDIPENLQVGGADIFFYQFGFSIPLKVVNFNFLGSSEHWDVATEGFSHVYLYSYDILIESQDQIYQVNTELEFLPGKNYSPIIKNNFLTTKSPTIQNSKITSDQVGYMKNSIIFGLSRIPISKKFKISMDIYTGYWTTHPHIHKTHFFKPLILSADLDWDITLVGK
ncbi:MAG: hypothetical protein HQK83_06045 [Fibrobacteria bacterium]|nr:hypothetical protein [Fibrobacteria bacterium]